MTNTPQDTASNIGIIFIHGAGLGGWIWNDVAKGLAVPHVYADYAALERSNNNVTLADYVEAVYKQVQQLNVDRVVIVAHSIGGVVGSELAKKLGDKAAAFVGVSAAIPKPGGSFVSVLPFPQKIIMPVILKLAGTKPPESAIRNGLGHGLPSSQVDEIVAKFEQESSHLYTDRTSDAPIPNVHTYYVRTMDDKEFPVAVQNASIAQLADATVVDVNSGHMPMLSHADVVSEQINKVIKAL